MTHDPIVQEVRDIREAYARKFNFDLRAIYADIKEKERTSERKVVRLSPKRIEPQLASADR